MAKEVNIQIKHIFFSQRLAFRAWTESDISPYHRISSDKDVMKFFPKEFWLDREKAKKSISTFNNHLEMHGFTYFAVDLLESSEFIGFIGMKTISYDIFFRPAIDIGWRLSKEFWGNGYATEGARRCMNWFFENFNSDKLVSMTPTLNTQSENVMKKIGMEKVCEFNHPLIKKSDPLLKHVLYEIRRSN